MVPVGVPAVGQKFSLKMVSGHHGQPAGWYMDAHRWTKTDERGHNSTYLIVHEPGLALWKGEFVLQPASTAGSFHIKIVSDHHGQPAGWYMDAHRFGGADKRGHNSTYQIMHEPVFASFNPYE